VKRSTDSRIRREVVGQMLDYAANALVHWPPEEIRARFTARCERCSQDPGELLADFLSGEDPEDFWVKVKTNLQAGKVRMVFVADEIPAELRRVVEFLNGQMDPAEVLAVEIKQYGRQSIKTLVARVIGRTEQAQTKKRAGGAPRQWDRDSFLGDLEARQGAGSRKIAARILDWADSRSLRIWYGRGTRDGSFYPMLDHGGQTYWTISVWTYGRVEISFQQMKNRPPFSEDTLRLELRERLNKLEGVDFPEDAIDRRPSIPLGIFKDSEKLDRFLEVLDWVVRTIRA
jgi:hypothetical protein